MAIFSKDRATPASVDPAALIDEKQGAGYKLDEEGAARARCCRQRCCAAKNVEKHTSCKCCRRVKCACCFVVALPVVIALSPLLIVRRLLFGPMCKRGACHKKEPEASTVVVDGKPESRLDQPDEIKVDKV